VFIPRAQYIVIEIVCVPDIISYSLNSSWNGAVIVKHFPSKDTPHVTTSFPYVLIPIVGGSCLSPPPQEILVVVARTKTGAPLIRFTPFMVPLLSSDIVPSLMKELPQKLFRVPTLMMKVPKLLIFPKLLMVSKLRIESELLMVPELLMVQTPSYVTLAVF